MTLRVDMRLRNGGPDGKKQQGVGGEAVQERADCEGTEGVAHRVGGEAGQERAGCVGMEGVADSLRPASLAATSGSTSRSATSRACVTSWPRCWSSWMMVSVSSLTCRRGRASLTLCRHGLGQDRVIAGLPGGHIPAPAA